MLLKFAFRLFTIWNMNDINALTHSHIIWASITRGIRFEKFLKKYIIRWCNVLLMPTLESNNALKIQRYIMFLFSLITHNSIAVDLIHELLYWPLCIFSHVIYSLMIKCNLKYFEVGTLSNTKLFAKSYINIYQTSLNSI